MWHVDYQGIVVLLLKGLEGVNVGVDGIIASGDIHVTNDGHHLEAFSFEIIPAIEAGSCGTGE